MMHILPTHVSSLELSWDQWCNNQLRRGKIPILSTIWGFASGGRGCSNPPLDNSSRPLISCCKRVTWRMAWSRTRGSSGGFCRRVSRDCRYTWAKNKGRATCLLLHKMATLMQCLQRFPRIDQEQSQIQNSDPGFQIVYARVLSVWEITFTSWRFCSSSNTSASGICWDRYHELAMKDASLISSKYPVSVMYCSSQ